MFRRRKPEATLEVLLVHPGGPFWAKKDEGAWSIPKGECTDGQDPLATAKREFAEELGFRPEGELIPLTDIKQPSGKTVRVWAFEGDCDASQIRSNLFSMEWPPKSGKTQEFPEVDRAAWFPIEMARTKLLKGQTGFLDQLTSYLARRSGSGKQQ